MQSLYFNKKIVESYESSGTKNTILVRKKQCFFKVKEVVKIGIDGSTQSDDEKEEVQSQILFSCVSTVDMVM